MKKLMGILLCAGLLFSCEDAKTDGDDKKTGDSSKVSSSGDFEIGDDNLKAWGSNSLQSLASGDVDGWMKDYADTAIFRWSGGDSAVGKAAITDYWKKRRTEVIDSLYYWDQVWLPMNVNKSQYPGQPTGKYLLGWYKVWAKYKTGKSMSQRSHMVFHFNNDGKVDRVTHYIDRVPINAAAK